ncbi:hypothetical protein G6F35_015966 [Rhizopus arrhizus]|nr:hypothetical protein G6F35_015966 [Rhizopus arrhizus]
MAAGAVALRTVNVLEEPEIRANLPRFSNLPTFPQLFINGELIGGCDIVLELDECLAIDVPDRRGARWPPVTGSRGAGCRCGRWPGQCRGGGCCSRRRHGGAAGTQAAPAGSGLRPGPGRWRGTAAVPVGHGRSRPGRLCRTGPGASARTGAAGWPAGLCGTLSRIDPVRIGRSGQFRPRGARHPDRPGVAGPGLPAAAAAT